MPLENLSDLENEWAQFMLNKSGSRSGWTGDQKWRTDNPAQLAQLEAYRLTGQNRPSLPVGTGARMVWHVDAYLKAKGTTTPPPFPPTWIPIDLTLKPWTLVREVVCTSRAAFDSAYAASVNGDRIRAVGIAFAGQVNFLKNFGSGSGIEIVFEDSCSFTGGAGTALNCIFVNGATKHRFFGGRNMSNLTGHGVLIYPCSDVTWRGLKIGGGVGGTCLRVLAVNGFVDRIDIECEVSNNGKALPLDPLNLDPHPETGTGMHPSYIGGDETQSGTVQNSRFVIDAHDCPAGSNQIGGKGFNNDFYIRAKNLTFQAKQQTAGNAVQLFGNNVSDLDIWVEADNVAQVVRTAGSLRNIRVVHGRGTNVRGNYDSQAKYMANPGVTYTDCT